jgi:hypothetical protein
MGTVAVSPKRVMPSPFFIPTMVSAMTHGQINKWKGDKK